MEEVGGTLETPALGPQHPGGGAPALTVGWRGADFGDGTPEGAGFGGEKSSGCCVSRHLDGGSWGLAVEVRVCALSG